MVLFKTWQVDMSGKLLADVMRLSSTLKNWSMEIDSLDEAVGEALQRLDVVFNMTNNTEVIHQFKYIVSVLAEKFVSEKLRGHR